MSLSTVMSSSDGGKIWFRVSRSGKLVSEDGLQFLPFFIIIINYLID